MIKKSIKIEVRLNNNDRIAQNCDKTENHFPGLAQGRKSAFHSDVRLETKENIRKQRWRPQPTLCPDNIFLI